MLQRGWDDFYDWVTHNNVKNTTVTHQGHTFRPINQNAVELLAQGNAARCRAPHNAVFVDIPIT